jgi:hypothetical protein
LNSFECHAVQNPSMSGPGTSRDETVDAVVPLREDLLEIIE